MDRVWARTPELMGHGVQIILIARNVNGWQRTVTSVQNTFPGLPLTFLVLQIPGIT